VPHRLLLANLPANVILAGGMKSGTGLSDKEPSASSISAKAIIITVIVAAVLLALLALAAANVDRTVIVENRLAYYKIYAEIFKTIIAGFVVALLGIFVPALIGEIKFKFEKLQTSRELYSKAKTGVDYLPVRLCNLNFDDASALIQKVHVYKHQAELYFTEQIWHLQKHKVTPDEWSEIMYRKLLGFRTSLQEHADDWDHLSKSEKLALLLEKLHIVKIDLKNDHYPDY
jgi:hypothetical protein